MFKKLVESFKKLGNIGPTFDPAQFNDPVAMQAEWRPLKSGGANFKTHKLVEVSYHRLEFKATVFARIFCMIFLLIGLAVFLFFGLKTINWENLSSNFESALPLIFGLVFAAVGGVLLYFSTKPIVFDKTYGYYWKGRKEPTQIYEQSVKKTSAPLADIHALQIVSEHVSSSKSSYYSYEINLILHDGKRINVIDHGKLSSIREDAQKVAAFLGVPVWDNVSR